MGTLFGTQAAVGIRYFFLTDRTRPYIEGSFSTMHLLSFNQQAAEACTNESVCNGDTNQINFLPQAWVPAIHIQPGIEMIVSRDIALHIFLDLQHWFVINAEDNQSIILGDQPEVNTNVDSFCAKRRFAFSLRSAAVWISP